MIKPKAGRQVVKTIARSVNYRKGFTTLETLLAALILVFIVGCAVAIYLMSVTTWKEGSTQISLQREAGSAMEKMVRGVNGMNGIREAETVSLASSSNIRYTSAIDSVERSFYLSSGNIIYDPSTSAANDEFSIAENVRSSGLSFSVSADGKIVTINLGVGNQVMGKNIYVDLTTKVQLRN